MRRALAVAVMVAIVVGTAAVPATAADPEDFEALTPPTWRARDYFGQSVAVDGNRVVVGAIGDDERSLGAGAVWVFTRSGLGWRTEKIIPAQPWRGTMFGTSVAVRGDRVVVGAMRAGFKGSRSGAVFVYDLVDGEWIETRLIPEDLTTNTGLGVRVFLSEDGTQILAATQNRRQKHEWGRAYLFTLIDGEWITHRFTSSDMALGDYFGTNVGLGDGFVAIGAADDSQAGHETGAVYIFEPVDGSWIETKLISPEPTDQAWYGGGIHVEGDTIVAGAHGENAIYVIERSADGWDQQRLAIPEAEAEGSFGQSFFISGDRIYSGFWPRGHVEADGGEVVVFERLDDAWIETHRYTAEEFGGGKGFGWRMAANGQVLAISHPWTRESGAIHVAGMPATCGPWEPTIVGTNGDDDIWGTPGDDVIVPGSGSDLIHVSGGRDIYCLNDGDYLFTGGPVAFTRSGSEGHAIVRTVPIRPAWKSLNAQ